MRTNVRNHFVSDEQELRFDLLVAINPNFESDINYTSCAYLFSANGEIFRKVLPYIKEDGIYWTNIKKKVDLTSGQLPIIKLAYDLFTGGRKYDKDSLSLTDLYYCDKIMVEAVIVSVRLYLDYEVSND